MNNKQTAWALALVCILGHTLLGQTPPTQENALDTPAVAPGTQTQDKSLLSDPALLPKPREVKEQSRLEANFKKLLTGAELTGMFTIDGRDMSDLKPESYTIVSAEKQSEGDAWVIKSRIKYGKADVTVPVVIDVKWAGKTPVMVLDNVSIIGLGTFSARVVFNGDKYAGTWQHDDKGGHLFGRVKFAKSNKER